jgi:ATP-dependent DNA helicase RecQ
LDLAEVAPKAGFPLEEIEQKVLAWEDAGWLMYRRAGRDLLVELRSPPEDAADRVAGLLERYETVQLQRIDEIAAYAETEHCRHGHLNAYLGGRTIEQCDACDNCVTMPPLPDPGLPDERTQLLTILRCAANAPWSWGRQTMVRILRGDAKAHHSRPSLREEAAAQAEFGALGFRSGTAVRGLVECLERADFLAPRQLTHGGVVLDLTARGKAALQDPQVLDGLVERKQPRKRRGTSKRASTEEDEELDVDEALFTRLRTWRLEQAREEEVPAFVIFHNSHLRAIAACKPVTADGLLEVKGVGLRKLEKYGAAVIELVREHSENEGEQKGDL